MKKPKGSPTTLKLYDELENYRWFILQQLADDAEERGETVEAKGWRYLAERQRWPIVYAGPSYGWKFRDLDDFNRAQGYLPKSLKGIVPQRRKSLITLLKLTADGIGLATLRENEGG